MQNTALILRPPSSPLIHVLECDGPRDFECATVNRYPGKNLALCLSFEEFAQLPDHQKNPGPSVAEMDFNSASRVVRLIQTAEQRGGWMTPEHLQEIRSRMLILYPYCNEAF